jgi:uncharacterized protein (DUF1501 family)
MNLRDTLVHDHALLATRRHFLSGAAGMLGGLWLAGGRPHADAATLAIDPSQPLAPRQPLFPPRATRVIHLHMAGAPSQLELFDSKPELARFDGQETPASFLEGKRFAFIQGVPKLLGPVFPFARYGASGQWFSDRLPHLAAHADRLCFIKSMVTDQFNHGPAQLLLNSGSANPGLPSAGAWITYGLGSPNQDLPGFVVLTSGGKLPDAGKTVWSAGFLPSVFQGVQCRSEGDPVLFLTNPDHVDRSLRRRMLDAIDTVNRDTARTFGDPETVTRIAQYELAFRMQAAASEAFDISRETAETHTLYGTQPGRESFANNCLLARRLAERGVRFIQLFDWGWDSHGSSPSEALEKGFVDKCRAADRPLAALLTDLERRGLLADTLVVWTGEFGRTPMQENRFGGTSGFKGRDHNPGAFTIWLAGAGVKPGFSFGATDDLGYQVAADPVSVHDLHATLLHLLGFDHLRLTYPFSGVNQRLSNITKPGSRVVTEILA